MAKAKGKNAAKAAEGSDDDSASSDLVNRTSDRTSALDNYIPTIRRVNEADLKARFTLQHLTPVDGEPTFASMQRVEEELAANSLTSQVSFGGGIADASASSLTMPNSTRRQEKIGSFQFRREHSQKSTRTTPNKRRRYRFWSI